MATKVLVFGNEKSKTGKHIEFVKVLHDDAGYYEVSESVDAYSSPSRWDYITLLAKNYNHGGLDLMYAHDNNHVNDGLIFLGHYNDGTVG